MCWSMSMFADIVDRGAGCLSAHLAARLGESTMVGNADYRFLLAIRFMEFCFVLIGN